MTDKADYIIVGGGTAGCILAARLSEDRHARVVVLEAGSRRYNPLLTIPAGETLLLGNRRFDWKFETEPDPTLCGRRITIPRGRLLGGSNAINGMIFVRGQPEDYDEWVRLGATGWSWRDILPFFRRLERWCGGESETRGGSGPIAVGLPRQAEPLCDVYLRAAAEVGYPINLDYNSGVQEGCGVYQATHLEGVRSAVVDHYLRAAMHRPNLKVITNARVYEVVVEGMRCVGVRYRRTGMVRKLRCTCEVILSAGVVQSPQLLELSGIGDEETLRRAGVRINHSLPGVGENFHDHFAARMRWRVLKRVSYNERTRGLALVREIARYAIGRTGVLSLPIAVGFAFLRSSRNEARPDLQYHFAPASYGEGSIRRLEREPGMTLGVYPLRPASRGSIHIASGDPMRAPIIRPNFLSHEADLRRLIDGIRIGRAIATASAFDPYRGTELAPGSSVTSDDELKDFLRSHGDTSYHPVGTCRMGDDAEAVVDPRLRVRGMTGLRVVDASVMPSIVSGNTNAATMMIAEKAAAIICEDRRKGSSNFSSPIP